MKSWNILIAFACCAAMTAGAFAQTMRQPAALQNASLRNDYYYQEPEAQPSPSDLPAPVVPGVNGKDGKSSKDAKCYDDPCSPWRIVPPLPLGINVTGWIEGGATASADAPGDNNTSPVAFNDRTDFQMNQLYAVIERPIDTSCGGFDVGGRLDLLYGTDGRFTQVPGWELNRDGSLKWNRDRFYNLSIPQMYLEFGYNDLLVKVGHFYTTIGYEVVPAPQNFFYSHAYTFLYAEPFTHTGVLASAPITDQLSGHVGIHNGWDNFDSVRSRAGVLAGASWVNDDETYGLAFTVSSGDEVNNQGVYANRSVYSLVFTWQLTDRLQYILQHDNGWQEDDIRPGLDSEWYGMNNYLLYTLNDCWKFGGRFEWFRDDDGVRVSGNVDNPVDGNFYEITLGANWIPSANITVRPEVRWDWFDGNGLPYDEGTKDNQFTAAIDAIVLW